MKRFITILLATALTVGTILTAGAESKQKEKVADTAAIIRMSEEYSSKRGVEVVNIGGVGMSLLKVVANVTADEDDRGALEILNGLSRMVIMECSDADQNVKDSFNRQAEALLEGVEKILEVKEDGETVNVCGTLSEDGRTIEDIVIFIPEEYTLLCFLGSVSVDKIGELMDV